MGMLWYVNYIYMKKIWRPFLVLTFYKFSRDFFFFNPNSTWSIAESKNKNENKKTKAKKKKNSDSVSSLLLGCRPQFLMLHPIAGFLSSENLIIIGIFARWVTSGTREDIPLDVSLKKWKISIFISVGFSPISESSLNLNSSDLAKIQIAHIICKFPKHMNTITFTVGRKGNKIYI